MVKQEVMKEYDIAWRHFDIDRIARSQALFNDIAANFQVMLLFYVRYNPFLVRARNELHTSVFAIDRNKRRPSVDHQEGFNFGVRVSFRRVTAVLVPENLPPNVIRNFRAKRVIGVEADFVAQSDLHQIENSGVEKKVKQTAPSEAPVGSS